MGFDKISIQVETVCFEWDIPAMEILTLRIHFKKLFKNTLTALLREKEISSTLGIFL